jgi:hypothetical protein
VAGEVAGTDVVKGAGTVGLRVVPGAGAVVPVEAVEAVAAVAAAAGAAAGREYIEANHGPKAVHATESRCMPWLHTV